MKKIILGIFSTVFLSMQYIPVLAAGRFEPAINDATVSIQNNVDLTHNGVQWGSEGVRDFIIDIVKKVITPLVIIIGVLLAILGLYELFWSTKEDGTKKWMNYILWWVIGIIIIVSANFLADTLVNGGIFVYDAQSQLVWTLTAQRIYQRLMFPFLKLLMFIALWALFIIALFRTVSFLLSPKEDVKKWARNIIIWNAFWILIIIFAKSLIEAIYGTETEVVKTTATNLWQIGEGILASKQLPFIYTVVNWAMWFIWLAILILIIIQAIQLISNPTDEANQKKMRTNIIYIIIWLVIIGTAYVVTNFLVVK